jgi:hypothetical protein
MNAFYITVPKDALERSRALMLKCARCGGEFPVTSEHGDWLEITVWQDGGKDYCCEEHMRVQ